MDRKFTLSCCSTVDLPYSYMESRDIPVLFYTYVVDGVEYDDDMGRDPEALPRFYRFLEEGKLPQTSQINVAAYMDFLRTCCKRATCCTSPSPPVSPAPSTTPFWRRRSCGRSIRTESSLSSTRCVPPPATACWWTAPPICGTRGAPSTRWHSGCWTTGTRYTTSSSPAT